MTSPVRWNEVTAFFGGTFDPPHIGHRIAVNDLFTHLGVRAVRVLPAPQPPHKPAMTSVEHRVEMTRLTFAPHATQAPALKGPIEIDLCELHRNANRPNVPSYSFDTLNELRQQHPQLAFVVGTDQLVKFPSWHRFPDVLGLCHWIVLKRKGAPEASWRKGLQELEASGVLQSQGLGDRWKIKTSQTTLQVIETSAPELSSTQIRETLARSGNPPEGAILSEVHAYLMKHRLYGMSEK